MKYCVIIMDGAAGLPLPEHGGRTCLELADTPNLDILASTGILGMAQTIPAGMEPSSSNGCMSVLGYNPADYPVGRAAIEATSLGIPVDEGEVLFRCNLVSVKDGKMHDYSAGHIGNEEAQRIIDDLNNQLGSDTITFFPGLNYRHILKIKGSGEILKAVCTPPHDIPGKLVDGYRPKGRGSDFLDNLMKQSEDILRNHPVNVERKARGVSTADTIWLFWGGDKAPKIPSFRESYGLGACVTSAVDVIRGLAMMLDIDILELPGITDGLDNDFAGQIDGALESLEKYDLAAVHIEAPDEEGHHGSVDNKVEAIQRIDTEVISRLISWKYNDLRVLVMPDHPTPIEIRTHSSDPVPFLLWGEGFSSNGGFRFTETEAIKTDLSIDPAYTIMKRLIGERI
ncbi:MAG TPA: cofactor-independent phosphoglycerate mutase [Dehalococcoidia bacterium]|nr:cofactor-independent phosphoglycerate mutase [Dehalococcoidia bacterium]